VTREEQVVGDLVEILGLLAVPGAALTFGWTLVVVGGLAHEDRLVIRVSPATGT
jgi:hypothetical protein